jgi:23S rRNA pseudouridine1911/1915/1917 synthase
MSPRRGTPDRDDDPIVVPQTLDGERVDRAIALLTGWSRAEVQALLRDGEVLVGGKTVGKSHRLRAGDVVDLRGAPAAETEPVAEAMPIEVRYEDDQVIVVNKPAGLVVHPGAGHAHGTLVQGLLARYPELAGVGERSRPGIVHRLDRDTSGLLVVARTARAHEHLVDALARRDVEREYLALVSGRPASARGVVDAPIGRSAQRRTRMAVRDGGRPARTSFEVLSTWPDTGVTLLTCGLETGRTHQIRVHLSAVGLPVVGDVVYGGPRQVASAELDRPFLHATRLAFPHPDGSGRRSFEEPLPPELVALLSALGPDALGPPAG